MFSKASIFWSSTNLLTSSEGITFICILLTIIVLLFLSEIE